MPNPFFYGGRVNPEQFVGRRAELQRIFAGLEVAHTGQMQSFSVVGPRRIGRSSLLFYVANRHARYLTQADNYRFAYVDLQDASCKTLDGLLKRILREFGVDKHNAQVTLERFQDAVVALKDGGALPVICLDEFEELMHHSNEFNVDLYDSWRYLMNNNAAAFITASKTPLNELAQAQRYTSPFFNIFTFVRLDEFTDDEALELIDRGVKCDHPFGNAERNQMSNLAGNHPYKLQLAGHLIYDARVSGEPIDWDKLRPEFDRQLEQAGIEENVFAKTAREKWTDALKWFFIDLPRMIGRAILESILRLNRDSFSETTAWLVGTGALVAVVLVLLGVIRFTWDDIWTTIDRVRGK